MTALLAFWSHALGAVAFASALLLQLRAGTGATGNRLMLAGLLMTAAWAWLTAVQPGSMLAAHAETARNLMWVALLHALFASSREEGTRERGVALVYAAVAGVLGLQFVLDSLLPYVPAREAPGLAATGTLLRITAAAGALVLVHNLYGQAAPGSRGGIRLPMLGLALLWVYDLNFHTLTYLHLPVADSLEHGRGVAAALAAPLFVLGTGDPERWRVKLSRAATFQSLSLLAICAYFALMAILATALRTPGWAWLQGLSVALLAAMTVGLLVLLPSPRARGWIKVKIAKHFFEHRYDYRSEWLRFADTLGRSGPEAAPLSERVIKALADIVDAPGGLLLATDEGGRVELGGIWNWSGRAPAFGSLDALWPALEAQGRVLELDAHRHRWDSPRDLQLQLPADLLDERDLWAGIPLIHNDRLVGLVLLAAPELRRPLDWEDFDLLRTAGRQAASSLAEAHGQQALTDAQRFEEFNRRFAFILHDIKNLVSQLSLLSRNAERHADNPEFRADMIATLKSSVGKMNDLLARLAPQAGGTGQAPVAFPLRQTLAAAVTAHRSSHDVQLLGDASAEVLGDAQALEQAVGHLLQNAIDASPPAEPVTVRVTRSSDAVTIDIADQGPGMSAEFVRTRLFQPFASTKDGGFGIGAYEARSLIHAMGGHLSVDSRPGHGTRFTIHLPAANPAAFGAADLKKCA